MKKDFLIILIILQISVLNGQTLFFKVGPSISNLKTDATPGACTVIDEKGMIGFNAIFCLDYLNRRYYNFSSGFGFIQGGGKEEIVNNGSAYQIESISVKLNFLTLNTTWKLKVPIKDVIEPYVNIGPRVDYLVSSTHVNDLFITDPEMNKIIFGVILGGGMTFKINNLNLGVGCDYYLNFNKVINNQEHDETISVNLITVNAIIGFQL